MAFDFRKVTRSEVGKKARRTMSSMLGLPENSNEDNFNFAEFVISKYGSIEQLKYKAKLKDWEAQGLLSSVYKEGIPEFGIKKDLDMAIDLLESSMKNGNDSLFDRFELGSLHDLKETVCHQERAYKLYLEAARYGQLNAQLHLAEMYRCGVEGVLDRDLEEAFKWYRRAAGEEPQHFIEQRSLHPSNFMQGNFQNLAIDYKFAALKSLHKYYMRGDCPEGEPQPVKALHYLKKAAELGDAEAQKDLGLAYLTGGPGHPKDVNKAKRWLGKAAQNGQQEAKQVLENFDQQNIVDEGETEKDQLQDLDAARQLRDLWRLKVDQDTMHPYLIKHKMVFDESMFTQFPDSPTAKHYLKAFQLVKRGLEIIKESHFKDVKGISLLAHGYLYENSIRQSFPILHLADTSTFPIFDWIDQILENNPSFFEGLLMMIALYPCNLYFNFESCKLDLRKTMTLSNLIHLIKKAEPDEKPKQDPYNFEEDYRSWLHVLYYLLGSNFIITGCYKDGAEAFDMALKCCPKYFEAKLPLGHCLMNLKFTKHQREYDSNDTEKLLEMFAIPKNQRILKGDYLSWTDHELKEKAKQLFMEYIEEAPECDKKYQDGYYNLALLYMREGNLEEAVKWKEKGEDSEEKRLPFMEPLSLATKALLTPLDLYSRPKTTKRCNNKKCRNRRREKSTLQLCPCRAVSYCGRGCQAEDWKEHKKTCSAEKKRKKR